MFVLNQLSTIVSTIFLFTLLGKRLKHIRWTLYRLTRFDRR